MDKITVARDGSGNYNCDSGNAHVEINKALREAAKEPGTTVYLKGGNGKKYVIDDTLVISAGTTLEGDPDAVLTIEDDNSWGKQKPLIQNDSTKNTGGKITIRGFEIDGNAGKQNHNRGDGFHNFAHIWYDAVELSDMYMHDSLGDGLKTKYSPEVKYFKNRVYKLGHDPLYAIECQNVEAWDNVTRCKTNSALRIWNSNHVKLHHNSMYTEFEEDASGPGIQIQYIREDKAQPMNDIEVYNNNIYNMYGPGIWLIGMGKPYAKSEACNVHFFNNVITGCGTHRTYDWLGGIVMSGFYDTLIEHNLFAGNYNAAITWMYPSEPRFSGLEPKGTTAQYDTFVRNNVIINTIKRKFEPDGTGCGIFNKYPKYHTFHLENNLMYNNIGGNTNFEIVTGAAALKVIDNRLREGSPMSVLKTSGFIDIGGSEAGRYRGLVGLDLANIPSDFGAAKLSLFWYFPEKQTRARDTIVEVYRPAAVWNPDYATWLTKDNGIAWNKPGGDWYDKAGTLQGSEPYAALTLAGSKIPDNKYYDLDITDLVKEYVSGKYPNTGIFLKAKEESANYIAFYSSEAGSTSKLPKIVVS